MHLGIAKREELLPAWSGHGRRQRSKTVPWDAPLIGIRGWNRPTRDHRSEPAVCERHSGNVSGHETGCRRNHRRAWVSRRLAKARSRYGPHLHGGSEGKAGRGRRADTASATGHAVRVRFPVGHDCRGLVIATGGWAGVRPRPGSAVHRVLTDILARVVPWSARSRAPLAYRGAVTYGGYELRSNFILGPAVDEAARAHDAAQGALIWLMPSAREIVADWLRNQPTNTHLVRFDVPLKGGDVFHSYTVSPLGRWHKLPCQLDLAASEVDIVVQAEKVVSIGGLSAGRRRARCARNHASTALYLRGEPELGGRGCEVRQHAQAPHPLLRFAGLEATGGTSASCRRAPAT